MSNLETLIESRWYRYNFKEREKSICILLKTECSLLIETNWVYFYNNLISFLNNLFTTKQWNPSGFIHNILIKVNYRYNIFYLDFINTCEKFIILNSIIFFFNFPHESNFDTNKHKIINIARCDSSIFFQIHNQLIFIAEKLLLNETETIVEFYVNIFWLKIYAVYTTKYNCMLTAGLDIIEKNQTFYGEKY